MENKIHTVEVTFYPFNNEILLPESLRHKLVRFKNFQPIQGMRYKLGLKKCTDDPYFDFVIKHYKVIEDDLFIKETDVSVLVSKNNELVPELTFAIDVNLCLHDRLKILESKFKTKEFQLKNYKEIQDFTQAYKQACDKVYNRCKKHLKK